MTMKNTEKRTKARAEARPKKVIELFGWTITADERNYITNCEKEDNRYFSTFESALYHISEQMEKTDSYKDIKDAIKQIKDTKASFLKALSTALHKQG